MNSRARLFGGTLIISGTTIGAGMIALPIASAHLGFVTSTVLLVSMWLLMSYTALVTLEVNLHFGHGINVSNAAEVLLGKWGRVVSSSAILLLFYALLAAYTAGGSSILAGGIEKWLCYTVPKHLVSVGFAAVLGFFVYARTRAVDFLNRLLFAGMLIFFVGLIYLLLPVVESENLMSSASQFGPFWTVIPIFFASFGFHGSIPPLVDYLGNNPARLRFAFLVGSFIPLLFYLLWQTVTVGVLPLFGEISFSNVFAADSDVGIFIYQLNLRADSPVLPWFSNVFTSLAIATSFLGVGIGFLEFFLQKLQLDYTRKNRLFGSLLTFLLPLGFAILCPKAFVMAFGVAAAALSIIAVIMPVLMVFVIRRKHQAGEPVSYKVPGGKPCLVLALIIGLIVVGIPLASPRVIYQ